MRIDLSPELQDKLSRPAARRGVPAAELVREAIERAVDLDYDDWFIREVEAGLAQIDSGSVMTHDAVVARMSKVTRHNTRR
jgi:predicted transcriptional regulator